MNVQQIIHKVLMLFVFVSYLPVATRDKGAAGKGVAFILPRAFNRTFKVYFKDYFV